MSSRVRQDEPPGQSRQRSIANLNETTSPNFRLNFRLTFLSFVYFGKQPYGVMSSGKITVMVVPLPKADLQPIVPPYNLTTEST